MKARKKVVPKRKPGRPFTGGRDPVYSVRLPEELVARFDQWCGQDTTRSEAIRRLIENALKGKS